VVPARIQKGPETIRDLGAGVPNDAELEPAGGVPHRLGGAAEAGGLSFLPWFRRFQARGRRAWGGGSAESRAVG